jgi:hypothetical protein
MISGGEPAEPNGVAPTRRCIRVASSEKGYSKDPIVDGPCLSLHRMEIPIVDAPGAKVDDKKAGDKKPKADEPAAEKKAPPAETK